MTCDRACLDEVGNGGQAEEAEAYCQRATTLANRVLEEMPADARTAEVDASAYNLLGNIAAIRQDYPTAIGFYDRATALMPEYAYAWHDKFAAYDGLARTGDVRLDAMREALDAVKRTGAGVPGLGPAQLRLLKRNLSFWERGGRGG